MSNGLSNARRNLHGGSAIYRAKFERLKKQAHAASEEAVPGEIGDVQRMRAALMMVAALRAARKGYGLMRLSVMRRATGYAPCRVPVKQREAA